MHNAKRTHNKKHQYQNCGCYRQNVFHHMFSVHLCIYPFIQLYCTLIIPYSSPLCQEFCENICATIRRSVQPFLFNNMIRNTFSKNPKKLSKNLLTNHFVCGIIYMLRKAICESGGTGRRARLRGVWIHRTGSSPVSRTKGSVNSEPFSFFS